MIVLTFAKELGYLHASMIDVYSITYKLCAKATVVTSLHLSFFAFLERFIDTIWFSGDNANSLHALNAYMQPLSLQRTLNVTCRHGMGTFTLKCRAPRWLSTKACRIFVSCRRQSDIWRQSLNGAASLSLSTSPDCYNHSNRHLITLSNENGVNRNALAQSNQGCAFLVHF